MFGLIYFENELFALEMMTLFQIRLEITLDVLKNVYHFLKKFYFLNAQFSISKNIKFRLNSLDNIDHFKQILI